MREITYIKRTNERFDKFVDAMNKKEMEQKPTKWYNRKSVFYYKNYREGVLFGDNTQITYLKDRNILSSLRYNKECYSLESMFDTAYKDLNDMKEAKMIEGITGENKKAYKLVNDDIEVFVYQNILGDFPKGSRLLIRKANLPVIVEYKGEIIKIVLPFVNVQEFKEV